MGIYKRRTAFINDKINATSDQEVKKLLSNGFIPESLQAEYAQYMQGEDIAIDSDIDKISNANYFGINPNKVAGKIIAGSGFLNPTITKGTMNNAIDAIDATLAAEKKEEPVIIDIKGIPYKTVTDKDGTVWKAISTSKSGKTDFDIYRNGIKEDAGAKKTTDIDHVINMLRDSQKRVDEFNTEWNKSSKINTKKPMAPKEEITPKINVTDLQLIVSENLISDHARKVKYTVAETLKKYNPSISDNEIKAWVYHKRRFGNPMKGWEEFFIHGTGATQNILLITTKETTVKDNAYRDLRVIPRGVTVGIKTKFKNTYGTENLVICRSEQGELIWINTADVKEQKSVSTASQSEIDILVKDKALIFDGNDYYPYPVFLFGNIYEKIDLLTENDAAITKAYGKIAAEEQLAECIKFKPKLKSFRDPLKSNRPHILCLSAFAIDPIKFGVKELNEEVNVKLGFTKRGRFQETQENISLFDAFTAWMEETVKDTDIKTTNKANIKKYYFAKSIAWPKDSTGKDELTTAQKDELIGNARIAAEDLFSEFLATALTFEDSIALDVIWNKKYNAFSNITQFVDKIPVAYDGSAMFKNGDLDIKPAQRQGLAYLQLTGSGCLAYDVGFGKGHLMTSNILSPSGYVKMGDLKVGDNVIGKNGQSTEVVGVYPLGMVQCYKVTFSDGSTAEVSDEHLWNVQTINYRSKYQNKWDTVRTMDIKDNLFNYRGDYQYSIPMVESVEFNYQPTPIPAYLLGALLGDGCLSGEAVTFSNPELDIQNKIKSLLPVGVSLKPQSDDKLNFRLSTGQIGGLSNPLLDDLRDLKLIGTKANSKFIPDVYKFNTAEVRLDVLRGLIDTDGYLQVHAKGKKGCLVQYTTVSKQLCNDVKFLCQSFGGTVIVNSKLPSFTHNGERKTGQLAYTLTIRLPKDIIPVSSEKQLAKFEEKTKYQPVRFIQSIEDIGFHEAQCIKVDAEDHLYVCEDFIVTHNTAVGILNLAQLMSQGAVKRPIVVVPKPTYKNWLKEIFGYWTDGEKTAFAEFPGSMYHYGIFSGTNVKINDWYNLSGDHYKKLLKDNDGDINKLVPENTITVVSYKGFEQMGFSKGVSTEMFDSISRVLMQKEATDDPKETAKLYEKIQAWLGVGNKASIIDVDVCGFDHLTVDEAHNFKNVFESCGKDPETGRKLFGISAGQSSRAVKMFFISNYVQLKHGKNVVLLTATPFTNSPLEIYSMLSFIGLESLNKYNLFNIKKFFEQFVLQTIEYSIDAKGEIITKPVIKSFMNLKLLQTVLYNHFHYKDNPKEAGVVRPCKIDLPNADISTYLEMNDWQRRNQMEVKLMAKTVSRDNPGAVLKAINMSLDNSFSPYLFAKQHAESADEFIENSPKIKYVMECIRSVKQWHEDRGEECSGIVMYSNRGKDYFETIKQYMLENLNFKKKVLYDDEYLDEVEIITGGGSEADQDMKELIKDAFNAGVVKVIIGTSTIREGVNLQARGTCLFDMYPEWNPTDILQLKGRIWRQGNKYGYIRFIMPLVINSMDNFINQKLDEKSKRISSIWHSLGDSNVSENTSDLDPAEIKMELVDDANEKLKIKYDTIKGELSRETAVLLENQKMLSGIGGHVADLIENEGEVYGELASKKQAWADFLGYLKTLPLKELKSNDLKKTVESIEKVIKNLSDLLDEFNKYQANRNDISLSINVVRILSSRSYDIFTDYSDWGKRISAKVGDLINWRTFQNGKTLNYKR